ncbi:unnamed protein product [Gordionus sp. m RMFG-2023]
MNIIFLIFCLLGVALTQSRFDARSTVTQPKHRPTRSTATQPMHRPSYCYLAAETGNCRAYFLNYYYDSDSKSCKEFIYGGCGGNANNFWSKEECINRCQNEIKNDGLETQSTPIFLQYVDLLRIPMQQRPAV